MLAGAAALAWKLFRPSTIGTALGTLGSQAAVLSGFLYYRDDGRLFQDAIVELLMLIAAALLVVAFFIFFFQGDSGRPGARRNWVAAAICLIAPISGLLIAPPMLENFRNAWIAEQNAENSRRLQVIVKDVTALCERLGDAPVDEGGLVRQLGHPMPLVQGHGFSRPVWYQRLGPGHFQLIYGMGWDIYTFDSDKANAGWVRTPF